MTKINQEIALETNLRMAISSAKPLNILPQYHFLREALIPTSCECSK